MLLIDNDPGIGRMLRIFLKTEGYKFLWSQNSSNGLTQAVENRPDVIILELDLPDGYGFGVLEALREWNNTPVLILTGRASVTDIVRGLDGGADDYIAKPFAPEELAARLRVLQREEPPANEGPFLSNGALKIDMITREVTVNGRKLRLTATEEAVLHILAHHVGMVVPRQHLIRSIWGTASSQKLHDLHVHIARLRRKFAEYGGKNLIQGDGRLGYSLPFVCDHENLALKTNF